MEDSRRIRILDVPVDMVNNQQAMEIFKELMKKPGCDLIVTPNSEIIMNATKDQELKMLIEEAGLIIPDGIGLVYASKIIGQPLNERVTGVDFLNSILKYLEENGKSIYLLGSKPANEESPSVADMAAENMLIKYPNLKIAGTHDGYFKKEEEGDLVKNINESGADFLCAALGAPKQEKFIYEHRNEFTNIRAGIGVGGSLDVWAGVVKRAPIFYQEHGLEWLYRFVQEPSRYKRMAQLPLFMVKVIAKGKK
ncbi:MAG: WecB/TagA/CpsF family glycosyltransferase [Clostridiales bacterium]|jgi:N-acetylglucosaminyldiphosphoundecaprenol N-acetyl-beta-D-mannosaminyltransferase|uniref:WecB/TagA/CpsF family glycosyltransferase n=1 Tax=Aminipila sp. TaxID=2060095 RepID=UPI001DB64C5F|nr:WecB/TagA/CpsF family glycosyltransferase [Aminipila sp.]MBE6034222.1 WecB/TagA/CpsF family glycosyltransferase [Clostridiales bacterium]